MRVFNSTGTTYTVSIYAVVEVGGVFYFFPNFTETPTALVDSVSLPDFDSGWFNLLSFQSPATGGTSLTLNWYGAMINMTNGALLGEVASLATVHN